MNKPKKGIAVDAWCSKNPGKGGYKAVDIATGKKLFEWKCDYTTNNLVEYIAIAHAIMWCDKYRPKETIWTDSTVAKNWILKNECKTRENLDNLPLLKNRVEKTIQYLKTNQTKTKLTHWKTPIWGQIPADFGRK